MTNKEAIEELKGLQEFINGTRLNGEIRAEAFDLAIKALEKIPQGEIICCKDCKYRIEEFRQDRRMKNGGYTVKACKHFADLAGYWCWGGQDNQFCSEAERKENDDEHIDDP